MRRSIFSLLLLLPLCGAGHAVPAADSLPLHPPAPAIAPATIAFLSLIHIFSTKIHTFLFIGQRLTLYTNRCTRSLLKGVTAYYELSTCDLYLISAVTNKSLDGWDIVGLSFGVKLQLF